MVPKTFYTGLIVVILITFVFVGIFIVSGEKEMTTKKATYKHTNRLIRENSPYLLQHAHNPVDWYPWGTEVFERAEKEDKPIFLSIGYSTCHWCHVMERESFENEEIAKIMNEHFICIKVDREQRPDVDQIYMNAVVAMTGSGGWPLSVFLSPDGKPFYGGTYFPPEDSYGRPGFSRLLLAIADAWKNKRQQLVDSAGKLDDFVKSTAGQHGKEPLSPEILTNAFNIFRDSFDAANGGFGPAPKFPQPTNLSMLLCYWRRSGDKQALEMVEKTLVEMANGGIYDHIGGGFHRYSTDAQWLVPHFEKMLYDQALLARVYIEAHKITGNPYFERIARETFDYVLRDMTDSAGGFYSAEDADSEGAEGTFYLWDPNQTASVLDKSQAELFNAYYGITETGNFERGKTILSVRASIEQLSKKLNKNPVEIENALSNARKLVFLSRQKRPRPHRDDKVITAWNGLMISSLAYGGAALEEQKYIKAAERCADFVLDVLHKDGRLMRYCRDGRVVEKAFLDDYALMIMGLLDLYEADFQTRRLTQAAKLSDEMIELFADEDNGGFFLTGNDVESFIARPKPNSDGAVPCGNSIAALVLLKLGRLNMNQRFTEQGGRVLESFSGQMARSPVSLSAMLIALNFWLGPTIEMVIAGDADADDTRMMIRLVRHRFLPNAVVILHEPGAAGEAIKKLVPFTKNQTIINDKATAYVCENYVCKKPVNELKELEELIKK